MGFSIKLIFLNFLCVLNLGKLLQITVKNSIKNNKN